MMKEKDFTDLLLKYQECLFDEKRFRGILNDLFPAEFRMNSILGNLFHLGLPREIEETDCIGDQIYYKYKKMVIGKYGIDGKLADQGIKLWIYCYGGSVLNRRIDITSAVPRVEIANEPNIDMVKGMFDSLYGENDLREIISRAVNNSIKKYFDVDVAEDEKDGGDDAAEKIIDYTRQYVSVPKIEEYKKALLREKYYLQKEGGRKYRVTNGSRIASKNCIYTYSFEMESELNLPDDAPINLLVGPSEATGSVLVCEGFQIIITINTDFGEYISQAFVGVEPWKLLEALVDKLETIDTGDTIAIKLIQEGPSLATTKPPETIPKGQAAAIKAVGKNDITVIWGPPGTGKTYTMAQIAKDSLKKGKSVLIVSHSNVSVDGVIKQTVAGLKRSKMNDALKNGKVLRYGYVRDEDLSKDSFAVAYNYALNHHPDLKNRMDNLHSEKERLRQTGGFLSQRRDDIEKELKQIRSEVRGYERDYVEKAQLVATTISKVTIDPMFDDIEYDVVMFDEVSMAYVPQIICAAKYAKEKLVLVGDFKQLAPIVQSDAKRILEVDVFSYLGISNGSSVFAHPWLVMLNEQRRMHPKISAFPNKSIYGNLLVDHDSVKTNREDIVGREPMAGNAINLVNLSGTYAAAMKNSDNSRFNILSAIVSFKTALKAEEDGETSIGIITPYKAQTRLISAMIQDHRKIESTNVTCSTVHQFQGSERDLIIFDAVESYPASRVGWLMGKSSDSVKRLINVAVTRAKGKLIVVANAKFWEKKFGGTQHIFWRLVRYLSSLGNEVCTKEKSLGTFLDLLPSTRNIEKYDDLNGAIEMFRKDVSKAQNKIVLSIPDGKLDEETQGIVLKILINAKNNGISVLCKTNGYIDLPEEWKRIAWASENAMFPLIIIDDKTAWYGFPKSRGMFKDGDTGFLTTVHTYYRIRGEHTLEMIKSFTDFEMKSIDGQSRPLIEKKEKVVSTSGTKKYANSYEEDDGKESAGLDHFVRQMEKCPKCKSPMTVTRSARGKVYLKCSSSNCKEIAYLTPETVNWYINKEHVTCPIHHCDIYSAVGKYGIYVRCEQGHFLKPDEI